MTEFEQQVEKALAQAARVDEEDDVGTAYRVVETLAPRVAAAIMAAANVWHNNIGLSIWTEPTVREVALKALTNT